MVIAKNRSNLEKLAMEKLIFSEINVGEIKILFRNKY